MFILFSRNMIGSFSNNGAIDAKTQSRRVYTSLHVWGEVVSVGHRLWRDMAPYHARGDDLRPMLLELHSSRMALQKKKPAIGKFRCTFSAASGLCILSTER
jgi:hypothetical protein